MGVKAEHHSICQNAQLSGTRGNDKASAFCAQCTGGWNDGTCGGGAHLVFSVTSSYWRDPAVPDILTWASVITWMKDARVNTAGEESVTAESQR